MITINNEDVIKIFEIAKDEGYNFEEFSNVLKNPVEFNNGCCVAFAEHFTKKIDNSTIIDCTEYFIDNIKNYKIGTFYHVVLKYDNMYYDYEVLNGVKLITEIPFVKRIIKFHS